LEDLLVSRFVLSITGDGCFATGGGCFARKIIYEQEENYMAVISICGPNLRTCFIFFNFVGMVG
jgi:hypothetical protein